MSALVAVSGESHGSGLVLDLVSLKDISRNIAAWVPCGVLEYLSRIATVEAESYSTRAGVCAKLLWHSPCTFLGTCPVIILLLFYTEES